MEAKEISRQLHSARGVLTDPTMSDSILHYTGNESNPVLNVKCGRAFTTGSAI